MFPVLVHIDVDYNGVYKYVYDINNHFYNNNYYYYVNLILIITK